MSEPDKSTQNSAAFTNPCACCHACAHDSIPDRDLEGYVCRSCASHLNTAVHYMNKAGIIGCTKLRR